MEEDKLNHIVKDKIKKIEDKIIPNIGWNKEKSWSKIKDILNTKNKQLIMWYFASAASISVLVAATYNNPISYFLPIEDDHIEELASKLGARYEMNEEKEFSAVKRIDTKDLKKKQFSPHKPKACLGTKVTTSINATPVKIDESNIRDDRNKKTPISVKFTGGFSINSNNGFIPSLSTDLRYIFSKNERVQKFIAIGINTNVIYQNASESDRQRFYPATFINAKYGQSKLKGNRKAEWEMGAGYLINPNQIIYKDTTIRLQYTKSIGNKIKIGPEIIFTNNFKKLYPGFTLAFG